MSCAQWLYMPGRVLATPALSLVSGPCSISPLKCKLSQGALLSTTFLISPSPSPSPSRVPLQVVYSHQIGPSMSSVASSCSISMHSLKPTPTITTPKPLLPTQNQVWCIYNHLFNHHRGNLKKKKKILNPPPIFFFFFF